MHCPTFVCCSLFQCIINLQGPPLRSGEKLGCSRFHYSPVPSLPPLLPSQTSKPLVFLTSYQRVTKRQTQSALLCSDPKDTSYLGENVLPTSGRACFALASHTGYDPSLKDPANHSPIENVCSAASLSQAYHTSSQFQGQDERLGPLPQSALKSLRARDLWRA